MNKKRVVGLTLVVLVLLGVVAVLAGPSRSGSNGPLKFTVRMSKRAYAPGELVTIHTKLTNISKSPIAVFRPGHYSDHCIIDGGADLIARNNSVKSMRGPEARDIVILAPRASLSFTHRMDATGAVGPLLGAGVHTLSGEYDTTSIFIMPNKRNPSPPRFWKGKIKTPSLTFTIL
ncbi:MAG TPA: hypothetical protein VNA16_03875 [Abditibacteriaceae bacterium]|nr:hypothetical protein [Abditibacteriaceae bacterium]